MLEKEKLSHIVAVGFLLIAVQFIAVAQYHGIPAKKRNAPPYPQACTQEAKLCPDGSYVSRIGPNCAFAECAKLSIAQNDINDWQTYRNEEYGFEVKYPADLEVKGLQSGIQFQNILITFRSELPTWPEWLNGELQKMRDDFDSYQEDVYRGNRNTEGRPAGPYYYVIFKTKVDGEPALDWQYANPGGVGRSIFLTHEGVVFQLDHNVSYFFADEEMKKSKEYEIFQQILSTFKFIE